MPGAVQEIVNASNALNPQDGVTFGPFTVKYMSGAFENVWNSADYKHGTPITFYQSNGAGGAFLPLGDVALIGQTLNPDPLPGQQLLFAPSPSDPSALQHPTGFTVVVSDHGSGNYRDLNYYAMQPPPNYVAVGLAFGYNPDPNHYWCVRSDLVRNVSSQHVWSDAGQGWQDNGDLYQAATQMYFAPPTYVNGPAYVLVIEQADLQFATRNPDTP